MGLLTKKLREDAAQKPTARDVEHNNDLEKHRKVAEEAPKKEDPLEEAKRKAISSERCVIMTEKGKEPKRKFLFGVDATQLKYLRVLLREREGQLAESDINEFALVYEIGTALDEAQKSYIRVKFGWNIYNQRFTCACCRTEFDNTPDNFALLLHLEVLGAMMDFPICPACVEKFALFEGELQIKDSLSPPSEPRKEGTEEEMESNSLFLSMR